MAPSWGILHDPDTHQGIKNYSDAGLQLKTPLDIQTLPEKEIYNVAERCSLLLDNVYRSNYPHSTKEVGVLADSIQQQETHLFTLSDSQTRLIAMASLVHRRSGMQGDIGFAELSKAAKLQNDEVASSISVRHLSKYRLQWALDNLTDTDFIYGSPRTAARGMNGAPGGKQAQSVWWGGKQHGVYLPLIATNVGWNFRVGDIEPLSGFVAPLDTTRWAKAVAELPLFVPNTEIKHILDTLFKEATTGEVCPRTIVTTPDDISPTLIFTEARPPMQDIASKYYLTERKGQLPLKSTEDLNEQLEMTISQKIIIESDVATTVQGATAIHDLLKQGWSFTGWQPSEILYGGVCPIFARVNPGYIEQLIEPLHHPQYFDAGGLSNTRCIFDGMYRAMYEQAIHVRKNATPRSNK